MAGFLGMRGTGSWVTDQRPKNWREMILYLYPNGSAPLTAVLSKISEESTDDPEFNWWTKALPKQSGTVTGTYTDTGLSSALSGATTSGDTVYAKCAEADADNFREGHTALLRDASNQAIDGVGKVTVVVKNGANSYVGIKALEAFHADLNNTNIDQIYVIGTVNSEGAGSPSAITYDPTKFFNYTQIFRTPLEISRTAKATRLRTGDAYKELKREALELHSIEMEKAFLWGIKSENTGANGLPERTTDGLINFINTNASSNVLDYTNDTDLAANSDFASGGAAWVDHGEQFLDTTLEKIFRHGSQEKLAFCGSGALLGIQRLAKATGNIQLSPQSEAYGIKVVEWITPFGVITLKTHPLLSYEAGTRNQMIIVEPDKLKYRYITDTTFSDVTSAGIDGLKEEYLTECGLEVHHPECFGILKGIGLANAS
tara:strand:- start:255 stop:1544 length:1290 start_codon:yes stop_codon:yes gene_type:complete